MKQFKVVVKETPDTEIDRGVDWFLPFTITAEDETTANQEALRRFGADGLIVSCIEIDHDHPEQYPHIEEEDL